MKQNIDNEVQRTQGEWKAMFSDLLEVNWIKAPNGKNIATLNGSDYDSDISMSEAKANAAYIVKAVNNHEAMLHALKLFLAAYDRKSNIDKLGYNNAASFAQQAIINAEK